jgi:hypothetical protein
MIRKERDSGIHYLFTFKEKVPLMTSAHSPVIWNWKICLIRDHLLLLIDLPKSASTKARTQLEREDYSSLLCGTAISPSFHNGTKASE